MVGRRIFALVLLCAVMGLHALPIPGRAAAAFPSAECAQLAWYAGEMTAAGEAIDAEEATGPDMDQMETWTPADFEQVIGFYDRIIATLQAIVPPAIAQEFHALFIQGVGLFQEMLESMQTNGMFAVLGYLQPIADLNSQMATLSVPLEEQCQVALFDNDEDGELEIGPGTATPEANTSESAAEVVPGSVAPIGVTVPISDAFSLTIVSVDQNAIDAVPGSAPPAGYQFVNVEIKLGHVRDQTDTFQLETLIAEGLSGTTYSAVDQSCGFVNGQLSPGEYTGTLNMTGHVCFVIASDDVAGLRLYDTSQPEDARVYLSLDPAMSEGVGFRITYS